MQELSIPKRAILLQPRQGVAANTVHVRRIPANSPPIVGPVSRLSQNDRLVKAAVHLGGTRWLSSEAPVRALWQAHRRSVP